MGSNFADFISLSEYVQEVGAVMVPENWHREIAAMLPKLDLGLPTVSKTARIHHILDKKNPIYIGLSDGTKLFFTHDEYRRIEGHPQTGKNMIVVMQRRDDDHTATPSIVTKCIVKD